MDIQNKNYIPDKQETKKPDSPLKGGKTEAQIKSELEQ